ncbi:MAG: Maf-like protein [Alphaproteobacteria bacterium GM202ARS2]|nr:Maf-like protein [Alphaproteobacteria bacterium GM202ARS2]
MDSQLILASGSLSRQALLSSAGVSFRVCGSGVDETTHKAAGMKEGLDGQAMTVRLAEAKVRAVLAQEHTFGVRGIIGADQILEHEGVWLDKPKHKDDARKQLQALRGKQYCLWTSVCLATKQGILWRHSEKATLRMRPFDDTVLEAYLRKAGEDVLLSPGACLLERHGIQLIDAIDGDYFSILGLPLLPLLQALRQQGWVTL